MYRFACKDLGVDCEFVATAPCPEELKGLALQHADEVHGDMLRAMSDDQKADMTRAMEAKIKASSTEAAPATD